MTEQLHLSPNHRAVIEALLREHLPSVEVWAYGSRVNGRSHDGSDLDLVLRGPGLQEIPVDQVADFEEAVRDSSIPFLVEARDWARLPERFHREIEWGHVVLVEKRIPRESLSWRETRLGDVIELKRGYDLPNHVRMDGSVPVVSSSGVTDYHSESKVRGPGVVTGRYGTLGQVFFIPSDFWPLNTTLYVRDFKGNDPQFISYFLKGLDFSAYSDKAAVPGLNRNHLHEEIVRIPTDVDEQRAIAHILGTLDDKIELNRRMNETLEAMARALYKSWFVDFDPVHAKAALRNHAAHHAPDPITPPLRGSRGDKGASPQASRWGETGAAQPPRPWLDIKRQYTSKALQHAQVMRQSQTNAEGLLWYYLRNKQLGGYKFRRQQPIGPYIADFACLPEKLLIELDGGQHADPNAPDAQRDRFLRQQGYRVLRFWNHEVFADCFGVLERVYEALAGPPPLQPAPDGLASATPPQGGSDWSPERARAYLDAMDPEIAALFPDCFVDSELGEIPEGWEVETLDELIELAYGKALKADDRKGGSIPVYGSNGQVGWHDEKFADGPGIVVGRKGNPGVVTWVQGDFFPIDTTFYVVPRDAGQRLPFLYFALIDQNLPSVSADSAVPGLSRNLAYMNKQLVPATMVIDAFCNFVNVHFARHHRLQEESSALATLRDALLPKLVSGEMRVRKMEATTP